MLICLTGWLHRNQQSMIEYLQEEVRVLKEQLGKRPGFTDEQRRRLAANAKRVGQEQLRAIASIVSLYYQKTQPRQPRPLGGLSSSDF